MGWMKLFTGSSDGGRSKGKYHGGEYNTKGRESTTPVDDEPLDSDNEELDRAIALSIEEHERSLLERDRKGKGVIVEDDKSSDSFDDECHLEDEDEYSTDEDEQLARALHESMNMNESPNHTNDEISEHLYRTSRPRSYSTRSKVCASCKNHIARGPWLSSKRLRGPFHPQCFRCQACQQRISDKEFVVSGQHPYHISCHNKPNQPKCTVCKRSLQQYTTHYYWPEKYCPSHNRDRTPRCCSCERLEPRDAKYIHLGDDDGRRLCLECLDSAIMSTEECQPLYQDIQDFYVGLNMRVKVDFPMHLVKRSSLNEAIPPGQDTYGRPECRGLCMAREWTVPSITRRPRRFGNSFRDVETEQHHLPPAQVTGILVIYGLPRLLTGAILTHEMFHAWMRLNGYRGIRLEVEEGMAQVLAHMWLESEIMAGSGGASSSRRRIRKSKRSPFESKLGEYFRLLMECDSSKVYGDGFRAAKKAVDKFGLYETLGHIKMTKELPR